MTREQMLERTMLYALRIIRAVNSLPNNRLGDVLGRQLLRCGTSVGANYRAACRGKSRADFINKLKIAEEECDETGYWIELMSKSGLVPAGRLELLKDESNQLTAILVASLKAARGSSRAS